tara:strand:+ start:790 stop:2700 length:1911 start_codon:yes stop_codon:yes gene_type:complete
METFMNGLIIHTSVVSLILSAIMSHTVLASTVELRIIETTDLHMSPSSSTNSKLISPQMANRQLINRVKQARSQAKNSLLIDNSALFQNSPIGSYLVKKGLAPNFSQQILALNYDVGNVGSHEFKYGLDALKKAVSTVSHQYVNANLLDIKTKDYLFKPYHIKTHTVTDNEGNPQQIKIGYIGFLPEKIMDWSQQSLQGKVVNQQTLEAAQTLVPQMKQEGADIIIAIPHYISVDPFNLSKESALYQLTDIKGIDAVVFGHSHTLFPANTFATTQGIDKNKGTMNGVPVIMPGRFGHYLGVIDLVIEKQSQQWQVTHNQARLSAVFDGKLNQDITHKSGLDPNQKIAILDGELSNVLSFIQDEPNVQIVNTAQKHYVKQVTNSDPDFAGLPILSASSPFQSKQSTNQFFYLNAGEIDLNQALQLYPYDNKLVVLKINGQNIKEWLECSASFFEQIDAESHQPQTLTNQPQFPAYHFDIIDGINYQIDVSQPARYNAQCQLINPTAERIVNAHFKGKSLQRNQWYLLATNNYRAYGGNFPGTGKNAVVIDSPYDNRLIVADYMQRLNTSKGSIHFSVDNNWSLKPIESKHPLDIRFRAPKNKLATDFIQRHSHYPMTLLESEEKEWNEYRIQLIHNL